ncbi:MAG: TonB-dependent receptor, partial [Chitinophagaceae bacterium]
VPGTYYNAWGYFVGIDKQLSQRQLFSLTVFGAPTENGRQGASVQEMYELAGTNYYNPNWGYQNGKKRNASVGKTNQPVAILTHDFRINNKTNLTTAIGFSTGNRSVTALDWYNAADPRPDYYRYLPSYTSTWSSVPDSAQGAMLYQVMKNDINYRQINWQNLYNINRAAWDTIRNANGSGTDVVGHRSHYILEERIINTKRFNANSVLNTRFGENIDFTAGASYQMQNNHYYKEVDDLLGGEFYVNVNQFAERDFPVNNTANQYDLDNPNRILHEGDKFGYNYNINVSKVAGWAQGVMKLAKVDLFLAGTVSYTSFYREGHVRNGLFPDNSKGKGKDNSFTNYGSKAGITYKINGRNYIFANAGYKTRAPYFENVFISPRTNNIEQNDVKCETIQTAEAGYIMNAPRLKIRIGGYYTRFQDGMDVMSFYHDGYQNFVNYAISGIDKLHFGGEFGIEAKLTSSLTLNAAAAIGRYYYDSKQNAVITVDNSASILGQQIIYAENFRLPSTPMEAYSLGLNYRSPKYWFVSLSGNYFDESYLSFNPIRRTWDALQYADPKSDTYHKIFDQTKFDSQFTLDFFGGYSWKLPKSFEINKKATFLVFNVGVNNILNNKNIVTGGYEQLRYDAQTSTTDQLKVDKFPPKLFYAYGLNFFSSVTLRF